MIKTKRKSPAGVPTNDLVFSACTGTNDEVFPSILSLYVPTGSQVADVTYGKGVFWRNVPVSRYDVLPTDLVTGVDCRTLPYADVSIDCVVFDPPYMCTLRVVQPTQIIRIMRHIIETIRLLPPESTMRRFLIFTSPWQWRPLGYCVPRGRIS